MTDPVKLLDAFLRENGKTPADLARATGHHHTMIGRVLDGTRRPGVKLASAIDEFTDGKVPARLWGDWYRQLDGRTARRKTA